MLTAGRFITNLAFNGIASSLSLLAMTILKIVIILSLLHPSRLPSQLNLALILFPERRAPRTEKADFADFCLGNANRASGGYY